MALGTNPHVLLFLMGTEKIGFKESNPISKNMTKLIFCQVQLSVFEK